MAQRIARGSAVPIRMGKRENEAASRIIPNGSRSVKTGRFGKLALWREDLALRILRSAHVLKIDRKTIAGTTKSVPEGWALETIPIMEYG